MDNIVKNLRDADMRGVAPPQNWVKRAADEIERLTKLTNSPLEKIADNQLSHTLYLKGVEQGKCEEEFMVYDKNREALLEAITEDFIVETGDSYTKSKGHARGSPEYKQYIDDMAESKNKLIVSRSKYESVRAEISIRNNKSYQERTQFSAGRIDT